MKRKKLKMRNACTIVNIMERSIIRMAMGTICLFFVFSCAPSDIFAQVTPPITESGLNTQVSSTINVGGNTQYNITGGTRPSNGANVFHSFGEFGVPQNNIANFQNDSGLPTTNILSRVTGNNPSNILGTIRTEDFGDANLFLLNPNGVVFGPNASLDLNGSFHVSTADSIRLGTGTRAGLFSANDLMLDMLTSAPPSAFGFTGSNPMGISVNSSILRVQPGQVISIIGGDADGLQQDQHENLIADTNTGIQITASTLAAPGGQINLVSVSGPGTVTTAGSELTPDFPLTTFAELGSINITDESMIDVRGNSSGAVVIRGGRLTLNNRAQITAATSDSINAGKVTVTTSENVMINNGSQISTSTIGRGSGNAGDVTINATGDVSLSGSTGALSSRIFSSAIESTLVGEGLLGSGGTITIAAQNVTLKDGAKISVKSGELQSVRQISTTNSLPSAGAIKITAIDTLTVSGANTTSPLTPDNSPIIPTEISAAANGPAAAGAIRAEAKNIIIEDGGVIAADINSMTAVGKHGTIALKAHEKLLITGAATRTDFIDPPPDNFPRVQDNLIVSLSTILANTTGINPGAEVTIDAKNVEISRGANISAISFSGEAQGGNVTINSAETVLLSGAYEFTTIRNGSTLRSRIGTETRTSGKAGDISIHAKNIELLDGAEISAISIGRGSEKAGGDVTIQATENVTLSGISKVTNTLLGNNQPPTRDISSRITSSSTEAGSLLPSTTLLGSGGDIIVKGGTVLVKDGASIESKGFGNKDTEVSQTNFIATTPGISLPQTGNVTIMADQLVVSGTRSSRVPSEISTGVSGSIGTGNLTVIANNISIRDGGRISTDNESRTPGVARGSITLTANETLSVSGSAQNIENNQTIQSSIVARTSGTNQAGDIKVSTKNLNIADGGLIATASLIAQNSSLPSLGAAGSITINAKDVVLQERAAINTSATSLGEAGNIILQATDNIRLDGATLSTQATQSSGGNITLIASDLIFLKDSRITSSVQGGPTTQGGNISLDPKFIVLNNSQILAKANQGAGGRITLVGNVIFQDFLTVINATAGPAGVDGSVNIQAPIQNLSQSIAPLPESLVEVAALYSAKCAGQKGGIFSSFRQQGRDRLPFEPGELLPTPLFIPDLLIDQSKRPNTSSSPMTQRLHLPGFDSAIALASTWDISRSGCRS